MNANKPLPSGAIRKDLLTPCRRIGLSRKWRVGTFKSPLIQEHVVLSSDSPPTINKEFPVLIDTSSTVGNKRKSDNVSASKSKKIKKGTESTIKNVKKKLIDEEFDKIKENSDDLNVSGCNLLEVDEINKNIMDVDVVKEENVLIKNKKKDNVLKLRRVSVNLEKLPPEFSPVKTYQDDIKQDLTKNVIKKEKLQKDENLVKTLKTYKNKKMLKKHVEEKPQKAEEKKSVTPLEDQVAISTELETKPLINSLKPIPKIKSQPKSKLKQKNSFDQYIKKMEKKKFAQTSSSKLSLKKITNESFESDDDDFIKKPSSSQSSEQSDSSSKSINKSELIETIYKLQKMVDDKEALLGRYKQADVYQKLHNTNKLNELKSIWKSGCETALQDLLIKMRQHDVTMNMTTLLVRLGAPPNLIKYDEENDVFI